MTASLPGVVLQCDLQLSSDGVGFCRSGLTLDKSTLIAEVYPKKDKTYKLGLEDIHGWFAVDFTSDELINNVTGMHAKLKNRLNCKARHSIFYLCFTTICNCKASKLLNTRNFLPYLELVRLELYPCLVGAGLPFELF